VYEPRATLPVVRTRSAARRRRRFPATLRGQRSPKFDKCAKHRFHKGFCDINIFSTTSLRAAARRAGNAKMAARRRLKGTQSPVKKIFGKRACASVSARRIRSESRESVASDSRSGPFAMTFWRRCGEIATTFFGKRAAADRRNRARERWPAPRSRLCGATGARRDRRAARPAPARRVKGRACA
jgi:hypothetical protein